VPEHRQEFVLAPVALAQRGLDRLALLDVRERRRCPALLLDQGRQQQDRDRDRQQEELQLEQVLRRRIGREWSPPGDRAPHGQRNDAHQGGARAPRAEANGRPEQERQRPVKVRLVRRGAIVRTREHGRSDDQQGRGEQSRLRQATGGNADVP
jgi:hypothetical protein